MVTDEEIKDRKLLIKKIEDIRIEEFYKTSGIIERPISRPVLIGADEELKMLNMSILELEEILLREI